MLGLQGGLPHGSRGADCNALGCLGCLGCLGAWVLGAGVLGAGCSGCLSASCCGAHARARSASEVPLENPDEFTLSDNVRVNRGKELLFVETFWQTKVCVNLRAESRRPPT